MCRVGVLLAMVAGCSAAPPIAEKPLLDAPPAGQGVQLRMGPFDVAAGTEVQLCQTMKLPSDEPLGVHRVQMDKSIGSHHTIVFQSDQDFPDMVFPCWGTINFDDWQFVVDSQAGDFDWELPPGKSFVMKPHQQIMIQAHYVNARTVQAPEGGMVYINLWSQGMPKSFGDEAHSAFVVNRAIDLPPLSTNVSFARDCVFNRSAYVFGLYGHFHARGVKFEVQHVNVESGVFAGGNSSTLDTVDVDRSLYVGTDWNNPPFLAYPQAPLDGSNGGFLVGEGEALRWICTYDNDTTQEIVFGSHADTQEHCNLFFHYALDPTDPNPPDIPFQCAHISGGW